MDRKELDERLTWLAKTVTGALPASVVRWAAARGAPMARVSGHTAIGTAALTRALATLATPPRRLRLRQGTVTLDDIADRVGRDIDEVRRWHAIGLLGDPAEPGGDQWERSVLDRAALIDLALQAGAEESRLVRAAAEDNLMWVALEKVLTGRTGLTGQQAAEAAGVSYEFVESIWKALGLAAGELEAPTFERPDVHVLRTLGALQVVFTDDDMAESAAVIGRAMAEVASAITDIFRRRLAEPFYEAGGTETDVVLRLGAMRDVLAPTLSPVLEVALQRHLDAAIRADISARVEQLIEPGAGHRVLSVAFVDLVGFTAVSERLDAADVRNLASTLVRTAEGPVTEHGGRIVKGIGDAVMFTAPTPIAAARAATDICQQVTADERMPDVRAGIGHGPVLPGYADYFGRTVNLASRLCAAARPAEVLLHVEGAAPPDDEWAAAGLDVKPRKVRRLKGIDGNVRALAVTPTS